MLKPSESKAETYIPEPSVKIEEPAVKNPIPEPTVKKPIKVQYSAQELFVARVIYSETSSIGTDEEKTAICRVIQNRIRNRAFGSGRLFSAYDVCKQPKAFSCVGSRKNGNWWAFKQNLNEYTVTACQMARSLMNGDEISGESWMDDIVYYHDKSIEKPDKWDNRFWRAVLVRETEHFKFYKIVPAKTTKRVKRTRR